MPKKITEKEILEVKRMVSEGYKIIDIQKELNLSGRTISIIKKEVPPTTKIIRIENGNGVMYYLKEFGKRGNYIEGYIYTIIFEEVVSDLKYEDFKKWLTKHTVFIHGLMPLPQNTTREEFEIEMVKKILDI
ncbi:protein containing a HTH-Hin-like domain [Armadillidium vulgare iridescent virus]|uniref:Protein containing a HTH-Hin-like domain n=1 Tax=Armadillidium vulgare iridescent virus TaxID=72201 RepID=A0A068QKC6_9VIRU|nr:protein containing a HTH-Hin-like domain [Armadillidium vulgare iridescent virus]CCV02477.1 protein containing a HTH-Hin-like domain [Armadillidium vulgare iridescent virus]